jgi:hypothetical protein
MQHSPITRGSLFMAFTVLLTLAVSTASYAMPINLTFSGYVQGRYERQAPGAINNQDAFDVKRVGFWMRAMVSDNVGATIFIGNPPAKAGSQAQLELQHAYVNYDIPQFEARLGLSPIPFGYELPISSCQLITFERSQVAVKFLGAGLDHGLFAYYTPAKPVAWQSFNYSLAILNGTPYNNAGTLVTQQQKDVMAHVGYTIPGGEAGISADLGKNSTTATVNQDIFGIDVRTVQGDFNIIGEAMTGKIATAPANGGYLTVAYRLHGTAWQPYARVDVFDPNANATGVYYQRATLGCGYFVSPTGKVSLEYQLIDDDSLNPHNKSNEVGVQYQVIFK